MSIETTRFIFTIFPVWISIFTHSSLQFLPVLFYLGFDSHLIASEHIQTEKKTGMKISAIPNNSESIKILIFGKFVFLDSFSFQPQALSKLSENISVELERQGKNLNLVRDISRLCKTKGVVDERKYRYCLKKALFPYQVCTSILPGVVLDKNGIIVLILDGHEH